jgi:glycosyltransferase involved in cell wall biosynthesis
VTQRETVPLRWQMMASHVPAGGGLGGMVRYVTELAAALDRHPEVELSVVTGPEAVPFFCDLLSEPQRVHALPNLPTLGRAMLERFTDRVHQGGPFDVVHGTKHLLPRRSPATRVLTVHDMLFFDRPADFAPAKRRLLGRPYLASLSDADVLLCVSEATRVRMVHQVPPTASRSVVVPLAVSTSLLRATPQPVAALQARMFAVVVGDASPRKNLPLLVDSWEQVCESVPGAVLAIAGPPSWATSSHGQAYERLRAEGKILALGRVSDETLRWCYENAAVALCPSVVEGFGLPAVEALAFGTPLITSMDPALCEVSGELATHLPADRPDLWTTAMTAALSVARPIAVDYRARTWDEVADDTVRAVRRAREVPTG